MLDVYTRAEIVTSSREHILQNELGGRWSTVELIGRETNNLFGSTIDAALGRAALWIRVLLDAKSGDGHSPPSMRIGDVNIMNGGKPERHPKVTVTEDPEQGTVTIVGYARHEQELRRLTKLLRRKYKIREDTIPKGIRPEHEFIKPIQFAFRIDPPALRGVAKAACNLFALHQRDVFLRDDFNGVRSFILGEDTDGSSFVSPNTSPVAIGLRGRDMGLLDHLVCVRGEAELGRVRALVCLFKHVQFIVELVPHAAKRRLAA